MEISFKSSALSEFSFSSTDKGFASTSSVGDFFSEFSESCDLFVSESKLVEDVESSVCVSSKNQ